jgi:hypothetical protein
MNRISKFAAWVFIILVLLFMLGVAISIAHGKTTPAPRPNSLEAINQIYNPYTYLLALPIDGQILNERYTNIRFAPYAAPDLYDQSILFCGDVTPMFNGKTGVVAITYRIQSSKMYQGISCHELLSVFQVK